MVEFNILEKAGLVQKKKRERESEIVLEDKKEAEKLGFSFYDGFRDKGYGGYYYDGRWKKVAEVIKERYGLNENSKVLIDRCHKGFLVYDLMKLIPGITVYGVQPGSYAINHAMEGYGRWAIMNSVSSGDSRIVEEKVRGEVMPFLLECESCDLPFKDDYFDCVISIENACSYVPEECRRVVREIVRVSKNNGKNCYIQNDSWENEGQEQKLRGWTFLCKTFLNIKEWERLFLMEDYNGDWGFTIIE